MSTNDSYDVQRKVAVSLIDAARAGTLSTVAGLIEKGGVSPDFQESEGSLTALMTAAQRGHLDIVKYLLTSTRADVNKQDRENKTALIVAVTNNKIDCVKILMEYGADPNLFSKNGWTPLYIAANKGYLEIVLILLSEHGVELKTAGGLTFSKANIDMEIHNLVGGTVLMVASMQGHKEIVEHLVNRGAKVNAKDNNNWTALMKAADKGHAAVLALLIEKGADVTNVDKSGFTALHLAAKAGMTEAVETLLSHFATLIILNHQDMNKRTALFYAAQNGHLEVVKALMMKCADPSIADKNMKTPSMVAKDPTGKIQEELNKIVLPVSGEKQPAPDAEKLPDAPSLTEDMQNLNVAASDVALSHGLSVPAHSEMLSGMAMEVDTPTSLKRKEREGDSEDETVSQKSQKLDADYTVARWCGDTEAAQRVEAVALQGDAHAQGCISLLYFHGCKYFRADRSLASKYAASCVSALELAVSKNDVVAQCLLGALLYDSIGVAEDLNRARILFSAAADVGHPNAQYMLGLYYEQSEDTAENVQQALLHIRAASEKGHPQAIFALGYFHVKAFGVAKDLVQGFECFQRAAMLGHACALTNLGTCYQYGNGVQKNEQLAVRYFQQGADHGDPFGVYNMAVCHEEGLGGTPINTKTAATLFKKAADLGHAKALIEFGMHHFNGTGDFQASDITAVKNFILAADQDDGDALYRLGVCYMLGRGVAKDVDAAIHCFERAVVQHHACARIDLAFCLVCCRGTQQAVTKARSMLEDIFTSLVGYAHLFALPALAVIVPRWKEVDVSGYAMYQTSPEFRMYFINTVTKKLVTDKFYDISASQQWLVDAMPVLKAGLLWLYLSGDSHLLPHVDLAMNHLQDLPRDVTRRSKEVHCPGDSGAILRHAYEVIRGATRGAGINESESEMMAT